MPTSQFCVGSLSCIIYNSVAWIRKSTSSTDWLLRAVRKLRLELLGSGSMWTVLCSFISLQAALAAPGGGGGVTAKPVVKCPVLCVGGCDDSSGVTLTDYQLVFLVLCPLLCKTGHRGYNGLDCNRTEEIYTVIAKCFC